MWNIYKQLNCVANVLVINYFILFVLFLCCYKLYTIEFIFYVRNTVYEIK